MIKILYWNIKKKGDVLIDEITKLSQSVSILIIAELSENNNKLRLKNTSVESIIVDICNSTQMEYIGQNANNAWLHVWVRKCDEIDVLLIKNYSKKFSPSELNDKSIDLSEDLTDYLNRYERMLFYKITYHNIEFLLVPIHFPSKLYCSDNKQKDISELFRKSIDTVEEINNLRSIVVGDFNMNPFESGMIHHKSFHALPSKHINDTIEFYGNHYSTFYNPSWVKFGDFETNNNISTYKPAGSFYSNRSNDLNYYWYVFDQVILRKELIPYFLTETFKYITSITEENDLLNEDYSPNFKKYSDHLPITFSINA